MNSAMFLAMLNVEHLFEGLGEYPKANVLGGAIVGVCVILFVILLAGWGPAISKSLVAMWGLPGNPHFDSDLAASGPSAQCGGAYIGGHA